MTHGSLFSGIGGFDLAAEWAGWENVFHCEIDPFCQKVLKYHFPNSILHGNIKETDFTKHRGTIDILTGGFPCQPFSLAGKRKGTNDDRHLWPEMLRAIREIQPRWIVGENVFGIVNWDGGLVFEQVQTDLETEGYEVQAFILPACSVNAPHRRDRVWFVAYLQSDRRQKQREKIDKREIDKFQDRDMLRGKFTSISTKPITPNPYLYGCERIDSEHKVNASEKGFDALNDVESVDVADTCNTGLQGYKVNGSIRKIRKERNEQFPGSLCTNWQDFPTQSPVCGGNDGIPRELDSITFPKWRNESIKAYGNAIVPKVAYQIFKAINEYNNTF